MTTFALLDVILTPCLDIVYPVEPDITITLKDIEAGEELTCDYSVVDQDMIVHIFTGDQLAIWAA